MRILISGFEPFNGESVNPSFEAVKKISDSRIVPVLLPVSFTRSVSVLYESIDQLKPDAVVCVGQAGGRVCVTPEKYAFNVMTGTDSDGCVKKDDIICAGAPSILRPVLNSDSMCEAIRRSGLPSYVSESVGRFVCNCVMFNSILSGIPSAFLHVPYIPAQVENKTGVPSMDIDIICSSIEMAVNVI